MNRSNKFSPEVRERAVRMVQEQSAHKCFLSTITPVQNFTGSIQLIADTKRRIVQRVEYVASVDATTCVVDTILMTVASRVPHSD